MTNDNLEKPRYISWGAMALTVLLMVGASGLALLLIEPLSLRAAVRGTVIAIIAFVGSQLALRWRLTRRRK